MKRNDKKRQLLVEVLAGNREGLRAYQVEQTQKQSGHSGKHLWIMDSREIDGLISGPDGQEWTPEQLDAYPFKNTVWGIRDHSGGKPIPAIDDDYNDPNALYSVN